MFDPLKHHRHSIRMKGYDYAAIGSYFITICVHDREPLLGSIQEGRMLRNAIGDLIESEWMSLPGRYHSLATGPFIVMPNHLHAILGIMERRRDAVVQPAVGEIVRAFKSITAVAANRLLATPRRPFWQRNYYEHIIRSGEERSEVAQYIAANPANWSKDRENKDAVRTGSEPSKWWDM